MTRRALLVTILLGGLTAPPGFSADTAPAPVVLSLQDCIQAVLESNLDLVVRRYDPRKNEALAAVSESRFDPLLTGRASSSQDEQRRISSFIGEFSAIDKNHNYSIGFLDPLILGGDYEVSVTAGDNQSDSTNQFGSSSSTGFVTTWQVTFRQPLLRNLGPHVNRTTIVVARNNLSISESAFRQTVLDTVTQTEVAYWNLNFALMELKTARGSLQLARDFLEQNRIKVRVGTLAPIEITQADAGVAEREEGVIVAENAVYTAEDELRRIMGVPRGSPMWASPIRPSDAPPLLEVKPDMEEAVSMALANRPDLEQARLDLRSKEVELAARRNEKRWGLDFQGVYGALGFDENAYNPSFDDLRDRNQISWNLALNLSVPIGNRQALANYAYAEHALSQARYQAQSLEQLAHVEVRNAVRAVETNIKRVRAAQVSSRLQREKHDAEQKKFENGMSTSFQVLQFQTDLAEAETRENRALVDYNKSLVELERVKGTLLAARDIVMPSGEGSDATPGATPGGEGRAALRALWKRDSIPVSDLTLRPGDAGEDWFALPGRFVFAGGRLREAAGEDESARVATDGNPARP